MIIKVVDLGNYKSEYQETCPFEATLLKFDGLNYDVESLVTGKEYEIYDYQIMCYQHKGE